MPGEAHQRRRRLAGLALVGAALATAPAAAGGAAAPSPRIRALRAQDAALATRTRAAVLDLYALETKVSRARGELTAIRGRASDLRGERRRVAHRLVLARRSARIAQLRLDRRLCALYEQGDVDPLAVVLGADSLDTALTGLDELGQLARGDERVARRVRGARTTLASLRHRLAVRQHRLDRLVRKAAATARTLESTRASRSAYVSRLAGRRRLTQSAIARLEAQARAAREKAQALELAASTPRPTPVSDVTPEPVAPAGPSAAPAAPPPAPGGRTIVVTATGYALPGHTATGLPVGWGVAAVDPSVIPLGTHFTVPGYGEAVAADVGSGVRGARIDLWFPTVGQARGWGSRAVSVTLH